jgi:putative Mg2+ transporter-C (MgtC) family protein
MGELGRSAVSVESTLWNYLIGDWHKLIPTPWCEIALVLISLIGGSIVGIERERREKPAGLRTLVLVCLGSTVFTMCSYAFTTTTGDSGRVAAQIVTGIGFLGAGVILHSGGLVIGATTAATVWMIAAMGMTIGIGYAAAGLGLSLLTRFTLSTIYWVESRMIDELRTAAVELSFDPMRGKTRIRILKILSEFRLGGALHELESSTAGATRVRIEYRLPRRHARDLLNQLAELEAVHEIREEIAAEA